MIARSVSAVLPLPLGSASANRPPLMMEASILRKASRWNDAHGRLNFSASLKYSSMNSFNEAEQRFLRSSFWTGGISPMSRAASYS